MKLEMVNVAYIYKYRSISAGALPFSSDDHEFQKLVQMLFLCCTAAAAVVVGVGELGFCDKLDSNIYYIRFLFSDSSKFTLCRGWIELAECFNFINGF